MKHEKRLAVVFFLIIGLMFSTVVILRTAAGLILIRQMGIENAFTSLVFFNQNNMTKTEEEDTIKIKWYELYPFPDGTPLPKEKEKKETFIDKLNANVEVIKEKIESYYTDYLPGYDLLVSAAKLYEQIVRWNYVSYEEYNGVIKWLSLQKRKPHRNPPGMAQRRTQHQFFHCFTESC